MMLKAYLTIDKFLRSVLIGWMVLWISACSQFIPGQPTSETASAIETQAIPVSPTEGNTTQVSQSLPTPADAGLQNLVEMIKMDLANRLAVSPDEIVLAEAIAVEWSDSSLGCPQPDMSYLQVIIPGYQIILQANGQLYEYHSNRDTYFILCEN